ncbi:MAG TPA: phosphoglycerate kinase [Candidatus Paceibacterota bacterium]
MKYLRDIKELEGVKVLVRLDLNVPVQNGVVMDDFRIRKILPTILYLQKKKARIILMSHIESLVHGTSMVPVAEHLKKLGINCIFVKNYQNALKEIEKTVIKSVIEFSHDNCVILLENLREHEGEIKNDRSFARELASLGDIYINEAFAVSHREHASISAITEFLPSYAGLLFEEEIKHLSTAFNPTHPFLFILGGAKFETKLPLIEKFLNIADKVFIGGALANNFFKESGKETGKSVVSEKDFNLPRFLSNSKLLLPSDVVVVNGKASIKKIDNILADETIYDAGPETMRMLEKEINMAKYILWNGPLGAYEQGFMQPTLDLAQMIAHVTKNNDTKSILGGGDTLATINHFKTEDQFTFVSTGGGAMLEFLVNGTLAGITALERSES